MSWHWHDPLRRLLGDVEYTPRLAKALVSIARERNRNNEPSVDLLLRGMNSLELKQLRNDLADRMQEHDAAIEEAQRESWQELDPRYEPGPRSRPFGRLAIGPSGAIIDVDANEADAERERERARSLEAVNESRQAEHDAETAERLAFEAAVAARTERELPEHLRRP